MGCKGLGRRVWVQDPGARLKEALEEVLGGRCWKGELRIFGLRAQARCKDLGRRVWVQVYQASNFGSLKVCSHDIRLDRAHSYSYRSRGRGGDRDPCSERAKNHKYTLLQERTL